MFFDTCTDGFYKEIPHGYEVKQKQVSQRTGYHVFIIKG